MAALVTQEASHIKPVLDMSFDDLKQARQFVQRVGSNHLDRVQEQPTARMGMVEPGSLQQYAVRRVRNELVKMVRKRNQSTHSA
jgi:uncharacterized protein (DUF849 family)